MLRVFVTGVAMGAATEYFSHIRKQRQQQQEQLLEQEAQETVDRS